MNNIAWLRQTEEAAFQDIIWSRPENKKAAGKLAIIGGHKHDIFAPLKAHELALKAGIGQVTVIMPDSVPAAVSSSPDLIKVESSHSGGLALAALRVITSSLNEADCCLWPGALSRDSESTQLLRKFLAENDIPCVISGDALDSLMSFPAVFDRPKTIFIATLGELRTIVTALGSTAPITVGMQLTTLAEQLAELTKQQTMAIITFQADKLIAAFDGKVSVTDMVGGEPPEETRWRVQSAVYAAVLLAQFPSKIFESLTTAAWLYRSNDE